jgi:CRP/FNR family transcriptional regulator
MPSDNIARTAEFLSRVRLFSDLSEPERLALASRAFRKEFETGQSLFLEGEPCHGLYLLAEGVVKIYKSSAAGREVLLAIDQAPASIAEIPVFDGGNFPASAMAVGKVAAYFIPTQDFRQMCRENPDILLKLMTIVGKRLRGLVAIVHQVTFGSVRQRLARALLDFEREAGGSPFPMPITHQEIALRLGTVREVVSRNLSRFQSQSLIRIQNRETSILDPAELATEAETEVQ